MQPNQYAAFIAHSRNLYRTTLLEDITPFWMRHGFDQQYGGISNILDDSGQALGHDKFLWSQGRALWTFSALYNRVEKRPEWLQFAEHIYQYLSIHGRDKDGRWMFRLDKDGEVLERDESIYVDGFVMAGLTEYFQVTQNRNALDLAMQTYENVLQLLQTPGSYKTAPYEIPDGMKVHGVRMIFSFFFYNLGAAVGRGDICAQGLRLVHEILDDFYVEDKNAIVEFVGEDGRFIDSPPGRTCVPGHAIEALWFLISIFERAGQPEKIPLCCRLIQRHLELAWDEKFGGLKLALDIDGQAPVYWQKAECKPWWVQVEALVATAYAHVHTGEPWCLEWHRRVQEWAYAHYPIESGEWRQWIDREGKPIASGGLPVKDPFHLPRALIYLMDLFENRM